MEADNLKILLRNGEQQKGGFNLALRGSGPPGKEKERKRGEGRGQYL